MTWAKWWKWFREFIFGEIGISPKEFYEIDLDDLACIEKGFLRNRNHWERNLRRATGLIQAPLVAKSSPSISRQWPLPFDDELKTEQQSYAEEQTRETLRRHREGGFEYVLDNGRIIEKQILN